MVIDFEEVIHWSVLLALCGLLIGFGLQVVYLVFMGLLRLLSIL